MSRQKWRICGQIQRKISDKLSMVRPRVVDRRRPYCTSIYGYAVCLILPITMPRMVIASHFQPRLSPYANRNRCDYLLIILHNHSKAHLSIHYKWLYRIYIWIIHWNRLELRSYPTIILHQWIFEVCVCHMYIMGMECIHMWLIRICRCLCLKWIPC